MFCLVSNDIISSIIIICCTNVVPRFCILLMRKLKKRWPLFKLFYGAQQILPKWNNRSSLIERNPVLQFQYNFYVERY